MRFQNSRRRIFGFRRNRCRRNQQPVRRGVIRRYRFGFKLSNRPADREHPFGHARYEYIAAFVIAFAVVLIGVLLLKQSIEKIITPESVNISAYTYVVLAVSIVLKILQGLIYRNFGKTINSEALKASAADSRNDVFTTIAVLISTIVIDVTGVNIDGYAGLVVSVVIIIFSIKLLKETINPLLGTVPDKELVAKISENSGSTTRFWVSTTL